MKIAVTSTGQKLDDPVGTRPDKCSHWLVVDTVSMEYDAMPNPLVKLGGPAAGRFLAMLLQECMVKFILAGGCGCEKLEGMGKNGMRVLLGVKGSVREAVEKFRQNYFQDDADPVRE